MQKKKGFTLTELVVVIVIIGILAAVMIPVLSSYINRSRQSSAEQNAANYMTEALGYALEAGQADYDKVHEAMEGVVYVYVEEGDNKYVVKFDKNSFQDKETKKLSEAANLAVGEHVLVKNATGKYTLMKCAVAGTFASVKDAAGDYKLDPATNGKIWTNVA